jgi:CRISPR-associated protein Cas1
LRKLLNVLYVTSPDAYVALDGETVVIRKEEKDVFRVPLLNLEGIVTFGYTGVSPALMGACAKRNISLCFMSSHGRFLARVTGESRGNVLLRKKQYALSETEAGSLTIAKGVIAGKLYNARWVLERATRDHAMRLDVSKLKNVSAELHEILKILPECDTLDALRGYEGKGATYYFNVFDELILQQKEDFFFKGRSRRPPLDNVNALLSFVYTILAHETAAALEAVGLDAYVGFLHRDRPGRISLALDSMEELRPVFADRFVISLINKREVAKGGFRTQENGSVVMDDDTRKKVLGAWQTRKQEMITHPFLEEKIPWGLAPYVQAQLLARYLRGDLDAYPPFLWK